MLKMGERLEINTIWQIIPNIINYTLHEKNLQAHRQCCNVCIACNYVHK